jgi:hypothetical protein
MASTPTSTCGCDPASEELSRFICGSLRGKLREFGYITGQDVTLYVHEIHNAVSEYTKKHNPETFYDIKDDHVHEYLARVKIPGFWNWYYLQGGRWS